MKKVNEACDFCHKRAEDFRNPKWNPVYYIVDPHDRFFFIHAHKHCMIEAVDRVRDLEKIKETFRILETRISNSSTMWRSEKYKTI